VKRALTVSAFLLAATLAWTAALLATADPWPVDSAGVLGAGLLVLCAVSLVGMLVSASRWARRLGLGLAAAELAIATALEPGIAWFIGVGCSGFALAGLAGSWTRGVVRDRQAAIGPPDAAVELSVLLAALPALVGLGALEGMSWQHWVALGTGLAGLILYTKALPGAVVAARQIVPLAFVVLGLSTGWTGLVLVLAGVGVAILAWQKDSKLAVRPLVTSGTRVPIPPQLVPTEVLDAAGLDDQGRPRS
jgi:hypothetical protein